MRGGRAEHRVDVGDPPVRALHDGERDEVVVRRERLREPLERHQLDRHPARRLRQEGEEHAGEVALDGEHPRAVGQRRRHEPGERGDRPAHGDVVHGHARQLRERAPRAADGLVPAVELRAPVAPLVERGLDASTDVRGGKP